MHNSIALLSLLAAAARAQQAGTVTTETHPKLTWKECTAKNQCATRNGEVVLDANWRWARKTGNGYSNCYTGNQWDTSVCSSGAACAQNCAVEGADYPGTYGISTSSDTLTLKLVQKGQSGTNIGSRTFLMQDANNYKMFNVLNKEFTFDVDLSQVPCGANGALYFVEMDQKGGLNVGNNKAGAKFGTGYCDAQCPHDLKWIAGEGNVEGWNGAEGDPNSGNGKYGTCCPEMDVWEANSMGAAYTPHTCSVGKAYRCEGTECGDIATGERYDGVCDKDGCDFSAYRLGNIDFYGKGKQVDTTKKMTVVTQFIGNPLREIRRKYVQNGVVIENSVSDVPGLGAYDSITDQMCAEKKAVFDNPNHYAELGGTAGMGASLGKGHVLVMSIWVDFYARMLWLDGTWPADSDPSVPGNKRGECDPAGGVPDDVIASNPNAQVKFSNIRFGAIDSTY